MNRPLIAFVLVLAAAITQAEARSRRTGDGNAPATEHDVRSINERLDRIEALLRESRG